MFSRRVQLKTYGRDLNELHTSDFLIPSADSKRGISGEELPNLDLAS